MTSAPDMSTSDSDSSIDWLASDDDDQESPQPREETLVPLPSSSSSCSSSSATAFSCQESPSSCLLSGLQERRRRRKRTSDHEDEDEDSAVSPVQGITSVCQPQPVSVETRHPATTKTPLDDGSDTENQLFSVKCSELQCYIHPLSSILQGLKSGRYSKRLSSFQESVAVDRIQRIMGVLQNPDLGGRFLSIILKVEEMLQNWFPHIKPSLEHSDIKTPAKKQKLHNSSSSSPSSHVESVVSSSHLQGLHPSPEETPREHSSSSSSSHLEVMQDSSVSSSTDFPACLLRPLFRISLPCLERLLEAKESVISAQTNL